MLEVQNLRKRYGKYLAVDNVSFTVPDGKVGILLGPNGAGKSTIIKSIAGLLKYEGGIGIQRLSSKTLEAKKLFAYVPEIPAMFEALTVREHIEYIRKAYESRITDEEIKQLLIDLNFGINRISLGMNYRKVVMQKVSILLCVGTSAKSNFI